jgi:hypothetical protein
MVDGVFAPEYFDRFDRVDALPRHLSGGQQQPVAWVFAYVSIVIWGCVFVVYQLKRKNGPTKRHLK